MTLSSVARRLASVVPATIAPAPEEWARRHRWIMRLVWLHVPIIVIFGFVLQVPLGADQLIRMALAGIVVAFFGGAFGVLVLANLSSQRAATQIFTFVMLPQYFLAGIFNPIGHLPLPLDILSKISPMRYAVDFMRDAYYGGAGSGIPLFDTSTNFAIIGAMFVVFMVVGTFLFVRAERNR